jgi:hypothetical protein
MKTKIVVCLLSCSLGFLICGSSVRSSEQDCDSQSRDHGERIRDATRAGEIFTLGSLLAESCRSDIPSMKAALEEVRGRVDRASEFRSLKRSLAALGDPDARKAIIETFGSPDLYTRESAFWDARRLPGEDMVYAVAERLFDPSPGGRPPGSVHEIILPTRHTALLTLVRIVDDPTAPPTHRVIGTDEEVEVWKAWWLANKHRYQVESTKTGPE